MLILCLAWACLGASSLLAQKRKNNKKKDEEPPTQVLEALPEPPEAISTDPARISFTLSPLSAKGLLSQQIHDALKAILRDNKGLPVVKLRAFVAGSGDLRRVSQIAVEEFTDRKMTLPVITTVQAGALPLVGAQVVIEAWSMEKKAVNPNGLAFLSAVESADPAGTAAALEKAVSGAGLKPADVLKVNCYLSSLDDLPALRTAIGAAYPSASINHIQLQRLGLERMSACEAVARASASSAPTSAAVALAKAPKLVLTTSKLVFRDQDSDVQLAYQRLTKALESMGAGAKDVLWSSIYSLTKPMVAKVAAIQQQTFAGRPVAGTSLMLEGLPSTDATSAIELMATGR